LAPLLERAGTLNPKLRENLRFLSQEKFIHFSIYFFDRKISVDPDFWGFFFEDFALGVIASASRMPPEKVTP